MSDIHLEYLARYAIYNCLAYDLHHPSYNAAADAGALL